MADSCRAGELLADADRALACMNRAKDAGDRTDALLWADIAACFAADWLVEVGAT